MKKLLIILLILIQLICCNVYAADLTKTVSIGTSATEIVALNPKRKILILHNNGTNAIFLGFTSTDCTTASSMPLLADTYIIIKGKADPLYGIVASGTEDLRVWDDVR